MSGGDPATWEFHVHLDNCQQCRDFPFDLCPDGAAALQRTAVALAVDPIARARVGEQ